VSVLLHEAKSVLSYFGYPVKGRAPLRAELGCGGLMT